VSLTPALVLPAGGSSGTLSNGSIAGGSFTNGVATVDNLAFSEVGIVTLTPAVADGNYLGTGAVTGTPTGNVGRFVPARFALTAPALTHRAALGCTPADITWRSGVDVLSLGATKNGAINAEAVVVFDPVLAEAIPYRMKRGGQVLSKARFVSAQLDRYLADDRWLERARRANSLAAGLAGRLRAIPGVTLVAPVDVNMLFLRMPEAAIAALDEGPFRYYKLGRDARLVCRPDQEPEGMVALVECVQRALRGKT
jgi:threonine aldolase